MFALSEYSSKIEAEFEMQIEPLPIIEPKARKRLAYAAAAIVVVITFGATGFYLLEGLSARQFLSCNRKIVATTVGYGDLAPKTTTARCLRSCLC